MGSVAQALGHSALVAFSGGHRHLGQPLRHQRYQRWGKAFRWVNWAHLNQQN
jgi:hypothetical protein